MLWIERVHCFSNLAVHVYYVRQGLKVERRHTPIVNNRAGLYNHVVLIL